MFEEGAWEERGGGRRKMIREDRMGGSIVELVGGDDEW